MEEFIAKSKSNRYVLGDPERIMNPDWYNKLVISGYKDGSFDFGYENSIAVIRVGVDGLLPGANVDESFFEYYSDTAAFSIVPIEYAKDLGQLTKGVKVVSVSDGDRLSLRKHGEFIEVMKNGDLFEVISLFVSDEWESDEDEGDDDEESPYQIDEIDADDLYLPHFGYGPAFFTTDDLDE